MSRLVLLAFVAGILGVMGVASLAAEIASIVRARAPAIAGAGSALVESALRTGREGRDPGAAERRRLLAAGVIASFAAGWLALGLLPALAAAAAGPFVVARVLRSGRERYRRSVDRGTAAMATALADALSGGHSLRGAVSAAAGGLDGAAGIELRRVGHELALGARTEDALEAMRIRVRSHGVDTIVAAALLQRGAGGDLAGLLRECARALEDHARLEHDARAATAQARFTGVIVVLLPLGGALLAELASPGYLGRLAGSFLTAWLGGLALVMQVVAALLIRRLGKVRV